MTLDGVDLSRLSRASDGAADGRRAAGDAPRVRLHRARSRPDGTLSRTSATFEVEGPRDLAIARRALAATGTAAFEDRLVRHAQRRREAARHHRRRAGADLATAEPVDGVGDPGILLLDEPTAALDLAYQLEVASLLRDLQRRTPIAIVISTHDLNFAAGLCRTLVLLKDGRVLAAGATGDVLTAGNIRALYGVEADVQPHAGAGHLVVVPVGRSARGTAS